MTKPLTLEAASRVRNVGAHLTVEVARLDALWQHGGRECESYMLCWSLVSVFTKQDSSHCGYSLTGKAFQNLLVTRLEQVVLGNNSLATISVRCGVTETFYSEILFRSKRTTLCVPFSTSTSKSPDASFFALKFLPTRVSRVFAIRKGDNFARGFFFLFGVHNKESAKGVLYR